MDNTAMACPVLVDVHLIILLHFFLAPSKAARLNSSRGLSGILGGVTDTVGNTVGGLTVSFWLRTRLVLSFRIETYSTRQGRSKVKLTHLLS